MTLLPFQAQASQDIADRIGEFLSDEDAPMETRTMRVPLYLSLKCITGGGKTLILADAVERIRERLTVEPVILWVSTGKVVVEQTLANLDSGGKYNSFVASYKVKPLLECLEEDLREPQGLILLATVATFNVKDGRNRRIYNTELDQADEALWQRLKRRLDENEVCRPLIIVYDEGHNLSEQQSDLLFSLNPDALVSATATPRLTSKLSKTLKRLEDHGWRWEQLTVTVPSKAVVDAGLVKTELIVGGYQTPMEDAIDEMYSDFIETEELFKKLSIDVKPTAIYVCDTNLADGGLGRVRDDSKQPFTMRKAPPILIWRYLTEVKKVDPSCIAVYCDLKTDKQYPLPDEFILFKGGDKDYQQFVAGKFRHVIFNLTLQEGWDDPTAYFAYIDKSMGSKAQIEQLIGRVLRQPNATHYPNPKLNSAHFYVRVDSKNTFNAVLSQVRDGLGESAHEVNLTSYESKEHKARLSISPRKSGFVPTVNVDASDAKREVNNVLSSVNNYRGDSGGNTKGVGTRAKVLHRIGQKEGREYEWMDTDSSNRVMARALFVREMQMRYAHSTNVAAIEDPKFDALIEVNSIAATHFREKAEQAVKAYLEAARLHQSNLLPYEVPAILVDPDKAISFAYSLHECYSGLNDFELEFAKALDARKLPWARNPSRSGYGIPLLQEGSSQQFFPDFLVWDKKDVFAIDPKGGHLLNDAMKAKLLAIQPDKKGPQLHVRLVAKGQFNADFKSTSKSGYTVFAMRDGKPYALAESSIEEAVSACLKKF
jgi:type III restriction enzyme